MHRYIIVAESFAPSYFSYLNNSPISWIRYFRLIMHQFSPNCSCNRIRHCPYERKLITRVHSSSEIESDLIRLYSREDYSVLCDRDKLRIFKSVQVLNDGRHVLGNRLSNTLLTKRKSFASTIKYCNASARIKGGFIYFPSFFVIFLYLWRAQRFEFADVKNCILFANIMRKIVWRFVRKLLRVESISRAFVISECGKLFGRI